MPWELIVVGWVLLMFLLSAIRRQSIHIAKKKSEQFGLNIDNYVFPLGVSQNVKKNYPHLTTDQIDEVLLQLKEYFHMCNIGTIGSVVTKQKSSQVLSVGMPSKIVDQAWHEFILFTKQYSDFCEVALGRFLHHTPSSEMANADDMNRSMRNAWRIAWEIGHKITKNDEYIKPHIDAIITALNCKKDGHQRELLKILEKMDLNEIQEGLLFNECIIIWKKTDKIPSVRIKAFQIFYWS